MLALVADVVGTTLGILDAQAARVREAHRAEGERAAKDEAIKRQGQLENGNWCQFNLPAKTELTPIHPD